MTTVQINLPDELAQKAASAGESARPEQRIGMNLKEPMQ
jgi:hypothetical protein